MAEGNRISFSDFFNFGDRDEILQAIRDLKELRATFKEFAQEVTGKFSSGAGSQMATLAADINKVAAASRDLSVATGQGQRSLMDSLTVVERLRAGMSALQAANKGAADAEKAVEMSVDGLTKKLQEQIAAYRKLDQSTEEGKASADKMAASIRQTKTEITGLNNATKVTTTTFKAAAGSYNELDQQTKKLVADLKQMQGGMGANSREAKAMQAQIHANTTKLKEFDTAMNHNFRNVGNYRDALGGVNNTLGTLGLATVSLGGLVAGFNAVIDASKRWQAIEGGIRAVTDSSEEYADTLTFLEVTANRYGQNLESLATTYKSLAASTKNTSLEGKETKRIFESIVVAGTALKLSNEQVQGSLTAIQQMISKGKVSAEELRGQLAERLPGANRLFAEAMGVSTQQLEKMLKAGTVMATDVLPKVAQKLNELYFDKAAQNAASFTAETERLNNQWLKFGNSEMVLNFAASVKRGLSSLLTSITGFTNDASVKTFFGMFGMGSSNIAEARAEQAREERLQRFKIVSKNERDEMIKDANARMEIQDNILSKVDLKAVDEAMSSIVGSKKMRSSGQIAADKKKLSDALGGMDLEDVKKARKARQEAINDHNAFIKAKIRLDAEEAKTAIKAEKEKSDAGADARDKAAKAAAAAEKKRLAELERRRKEQDDLLKAAAALAIAEEERKFAATAQTAEQEIALENKRLEILRDSYAKRAALYRKDEKEFIAIQAEKTKAETDNIEKVLKIREKEIDRRVKYELSALDAGMPAHEANYDREIEFQEKSLAIILKGIEDRKALYSQDSDQYKQLTVDKIAAEQAAAEKIQRINESREKGRGIVREAEAGKGAAISSAMIKGKIASGEMTQYDADKLEHEQRIAQFQHEINARQSALMQMKEGDVGYYDTKKALLDAEKDMITENSEWEIKEAGRVKAKKQEFIQQIADFTLNAANAALDIGREINAANIEDLDHAKELELETVGNNAAAKQRVEEKYQQKTLALKRKQAIADKAMAIFSIGLNTAMAVMAALAPPPSGLGPVAGIPFSIAAAAMGALQIAAVLAKPLPKYAKGRGRKYGYEVAEINEEGYELIERAGRLRIESSGKRTATVLHPDDVVHPHQRSKKMLQDIAERHEQNAFLDSLLKGTQVVRASEDRNMDRLAASIVSGSMSEESLTRALFSALKRLPLQQHIWDGNGYRQHETTVANNIRAMNNRNQLGGNG